MASSYTSPLTVVRDVETSILDAAVLEFLHVGKTKKMEKRVGRQWEGGIQGDRTNYEVCQHKKTWEGWKMDW